MISPASVMAQTILVATDLPLQWRVRWNWQSPLWLSLLLAIVAVAWVAIIYFRETSSANRPVRALLAVLRLTAIALVVAMFAQPAVEWFRLGRPRLVVLVDRSASMGTHDESTSDGDLSRLAACKEILTRGNQSLIEKWQSIYDLAVVAFDEKMISQEVKDLSLNDWIESIELASEENTGTSLGDALDYALRKLPGPMPAAIVLFTDGITTRGQSLEKAVQRARALRVPLYAVAVGSPNKRPDVTLENLIAEDVVFPGDRLQVEATLRATGYAGQKANVLLRETDGNQVLAKTTVEFPVEGVSQTVQLTTRALEAGQLSLQLVVEPLDGENNTENNIVSQAVEVRDEKIRVLLVQASPSYEYRALKSLLERDPAVELRVYLQEADADFAEVDKISLAEFPGDEQILFDYDVVLLGDVDPALLPRGIWELLERFVSEQGGGLVCIAGPRFMPHEFHESLPFRALLPFEVQARSLLEEESQTGRTHSFQPTDLGWRTPSLQLGETNAESHAIWRSLPPVSWLFEIEAIKPGAQVLVEHANQNTRQGNRLPMILRHYFGKGEVMFHASDETWRWRWRSDDRYFSRYWGQVVRRLGRKHLATDRHGTSLSTDRSKYRPGEEVRLQAKFHDPSQAPADNQGVVVQLQNATEPEQEIHLHRHPGRRGIFEKVVRDLLPGSYEVVLLQPSQNSTSVVAKFVVEQPPRELARLASDHRAMIEASKTTGGKFYTAQTASELFGDLPPPRESSVEQMPAQPLWNTHVAMAFFVAVLTAEWLLRRRHGML